MDTTQTKTQPNWMKAVWEVCLLCLGILSYLVPSIAFAEPNALEVEHLQKQVRKAFLSFIQLWQEERYFELYDLGPVQSQEQVSPEDFATRMVESDWVPTGLVDSEPLEIDFRFRTFIYVKATIAFKKKSNAQIRFKKRQTFLLLLENGKWRINLLQMIRSPFYTP